MLRGGPVRRSNATSLKSRSPQGMKRPGQFRKSGVQNTLMA